MSRIIGIIIALVLMLTYSLLQINVFILGEFLPYIAVAIGCIYASKYYDNKQKYNRLFTYIIWILLFFVMLCSYLCKSELEQGVKEIAFVLEVVMDAFVLLLCFKLEQMSSGKISKKEVIVDSDKIVDDLMSSNSTENKYKARAVTMIVICIWLYATECFILPLIMKVLKVGLMQMIVSYIVVNALLVLSIMIKNMWFYNKSIVVVLKTLSETIVFSIGCLFDAYSNVYSAIISPEKHTIIFIPYLIIAVGIIPFLNNSNKMFELYSVNAE